MGAKAIGFNFPVCKSFQTKVLDGQLCYEVDINEYHENLTINDLRAGLIFMIDNNEVIDDTIRLTTIFINSVN